MLDTSRAARERWCPDVGLIQDGDCWSSGCAWSSVVVIGLFPCVRPRMGFGDQPWYRSICVSRRGAPARIWRAPCVRRRRRPHIPGQTIDHDPQAATATPLSAPETTMFITHRHRPAAEGARVDLHRGVVPAHVRAAVVLANPDRGDRRVRGGMVVLRWRIQGPDPGQSETRCHRCGPGEPPVVDRLVRLRATRRFRDRYGESPLPAGQTKSRAGRPIRPRQLLRRRILRQHRLRAGRRHRVVHRYGGNADPRHDQRPPAGGVQRPGTCCAAPSPTCR